MPYRRLRYRFLVFVIAALMCSPANGDGLADVDSAERPHANSGRFVAATAFAIGARIGDHAVGAVGFNFERYFYPLVEVDDRRPPVDTWTLGRSTDDATLIAMIGGEDRIAMSLSTIHGLIALGRQGDSHTDGRSNFAYARSSVDGRLWAIHWTLNAPGEWLIGAVFVPHPDLDWLAGARLFAPRIGSEAHKPQQCAARFQVACVARP
ncbi:hypothetical protein [Pseudorhodoplanes sp.]|uniref:hypothetical protein n=1 Tax=Pseudorhodoplanes sp. TaxID=1934341 RepID=UPI002BA02A78|nr:hypothetical protein [Pseudorhodoplanes sp.]HWV54367.1 hypothetical protein [Pseudorhodoplanes sp.]